MRPAGLVLAIAGLWILVQVLGGDALGRLGIAGPASVAGQRGLQGG